MPPKGSTTRHQPPPPSLSPPPQHQDDKHDILTVVDFVDALDALPIELTKGYGDLRELDAVLHSTLVNLTEKLHLLISLVSDPSAQPSARFQLLQEIAEEAARFKLGGDDKIRVAGGACDGIATHQKHISALLHNSSLLIPVHPTPEDIRPFRDTVPQSTTKRAAASRANNSPFPANLPGETPTKKKRAKATALSALATGAGMQDDDDDGMSSKAKKAAKEREREKKKKRTALGRALSPSESIASTHGTPALGSTSRHENARNPRAAAARARYADRALSDEDEDEDDEPPLASTSKNRSNAADNDVRANGNGKVKVTEADLQDAFAGRTARQRAALAAAAAAASGKRSRQDDDDEDEDGEDEHDEKPSSTARKQEASDLKPHLHDVDDDGDVEMDSGEVDTKAYCHCGGVSYGEMIGCDDDDCELEWYHLACVNLTSTPSGTWYCPTCTIRRQNTKPKGKPARRGRGGGKVGKAGRGRGD